VPVGGALYHLLLSLSLSVSLSLPIAHTGKNGRLSTRLLI